MGAWGHKALESDNGLDVTDFISAYISKKYPGTEQVSLTLSELLAAMKGGLLGSSFDEIDFLYDNSAMALAELYLLFKTTEQLPYEDKVNGSRDLKNRVKAFTADQNSLQFLVRHLTDIKNEVPDDDGEREIVEVWKSSANYHTWSSHLNHLISQLMADISPQTPESALNSTL